MASKRVTLKEAAVRITRGKLVAPGTNSENLVPPCQPGATPCKPSDHHLYSGIPSLLTLPPMSPKDPIFSCNVSLFTKSSTLFFTPNDRSQNLLSTVYVFYHYN